ncbi:MAG TPA: methyltransferase domain-containing protein [Solirubrobacteraceae bacterium]
MSDAETFRAEMLERWERAAEAWGRRAENVRRMGMPVSAWMIEHIAPQPGQVLLELAAGPGDTGFMAAELIAPGGELISSDAADEMLSVARRRATELGIENVEFKRLELEWIDLAAATVDGLLCRFGVMLALDPAAALREMRRVLRPGGRAALAVWDSPEHNPWATIPTRALIELGHAEPPDRAGPGMFALSDAGRLREMLSDAGFSEVLVESVEVRREYESIERFLAETLDLSQAFGEVHRGLSDEAQDEIASRVAALAEPWTEDGGGVRLTGRSLVASAEA